MEAAQKKNNFNFIDVNYCNKSYGGRDLYWTESAIECYKRGCICEGCDIPHPTADKCMMKSVVLDLSRKIESPEEYIRRQEEQDKREFEILEYSRKAILEGISIQSLAKKFGYNESSFNYFLNKHGIKGLHLGRKRKKEVNE